MVNTGTRTVPKATDRKAKWKPAKNRKQKLVAIWHSKTKNKQAFFKCKQTQQTKASNDGGF